MSCGFLPLSIIETSSLRMRENASEVDVLAEKWKMDFHFTVFAACCHLLGSVSLALGGDVPETPADASHIDCGALFEIQHGRINYNKTSAYSLAIYTCDEGFEIVGSSIRNCEPNGSWSYETPVCIIPQDAASVGGIVISPTNIALTCLAGVIFIGNVLVISLCLVESSRVYWLLFKYDRMRRIYKKKALLKMLKKPTRAQLQENLNETS